MLPVNFAAFAIASSAAFLPRNDMLLIGNDGEFTRYMTIQLYRFADAVPGLPMAPFEGMGVLYSFNPLLSPSLMPLPLLGEDAGKWLGFLICAALLFLSTYVLGCALGIRRGVSIFAAWILPPLCLPYQSWLNLYLTFNLNPLAGDTISLTMLMLAMLVRGYTSARPVWPAIGVLTIVIWLFLANPLWIMLLMPAALLLAVGIITSHVRQTNFVPRTALLTIPSIIFVALGGGAYLLGLFTDTAAHVFTQEMNQDLTHAWRMSTVATVWNRIFDPIGGLWVGLALVGLVLAIRQERGTLRAAALSVLAAAVFLAIFIAAYWSSSSWVLPYPIYFEFALWPLYALFAAYALSELVEFTITGIFYRDPQTGNEFLRAPLSALQFGGVWGLVSAALFMLLLINPFTIRPNDLFLPPIDTPITKTLQAEAGIAPNATFRGYVANLTGFEGPDGPPADWFTALSDSNKAILAFKNTHRIPFLWRYNIATIEAYAQNIEPALYAVTTRLLNRPGDHQVRNITLITKTNFPLMESLGVRFLITDYVLAEPAKLILNLSSAYKTHYLYELPNPNYGTYSPVDIITARDATDVLQRIGSPDFDFRRTAVLDEPLDRILVPAEGSNAKLVRGGWRIEAHSPGTSLLLLPLQFSTCLSLSEHQRDGGKVFTIRRANLVNTALVFEGMIDVTISVHVSPFWNAYCRLRDAREMTEFGIANLPKSIMPAHGLIAATPRS